MNGSRMTCRDCSPAQEIRTAGDRLKVVRINTTAVSAEMIEVQSVADGTYREFVGRPMGKDVRTATASFADDAIPPGADVASPIPAIVRNLDSLNKTIEH